MARKFKYAVINEGGHARFFSKLKYAKEVAKAREQQEEKVKIYSLKKVS